MRRLQIARFARFVSETRYKTTFFETRKTKGNSCISTIFVDEFKMRRIWKFVLNIGQPCEGSARKGTYFLRIQKKGKTCVFYAFLW